MPFLSTFSTQKFSSRKGGWSKEQNYVHVIFEWSHGWWIWEINTPKISKLELKILLNWQLSAIIIQKWSKRSTKIALYIFIICCFLYTMHNVLFFLTARDILWTILTFLLFFKFEKGAVLFYQNSRVVH